MMTVPFSSDEKDALQEVLNIAMGQAGDSLARILDTFVELSVPRIRLVNVDQISQTISQMVGNNKAVTAVRQAFYHNLRGEAIVVFGRNGCRDLGDLMGYDEALDPKAEQELLLDVTNVLVGAVLTGMMEILGTELNFSAPCILAEQKNLTELNFPEQFSFSHALLLEVNFTLEKRDFKSHLMLMMAEDAIDSLRQMLTEFMESI